MEKNAVIDYLYNEIRAKESRLTTISSEKLQLEHELSVLKPTFEKLLRKFNIDEKEYQIDINLTSAIQLKSNTQRKKRVSIADEVYKILTNSSEPVHIKKLTDILMAERKVRIHATEPMTSVASALSRNDERFESVGKGYWKLRTTSEQNNGLELQEGSL